MHNREKKNKVNMHAGGTQLPRLVEWSMSNFFFFVARRPFSFYLQHNKFITAVTVEIFSTAAAAAVMYMCIGGRTTRWTQRYKNKVNVKVITCMCTSVRTTR